MAKGQKWNEIRIEVRRMRTNGGERIKESFATALDIWFQMP